MSLSIPIGVVAIVLLSGGAVSAQTRQAEPVPQKEKLVVTPILTSNRLYADFGLQEAARTLPMGQWRIVEPRPQGVTPFSPPVNTITSRGPMDCKMVRSHRDDVLPAIQVITPKPDVKHHIKAITVPPCPAR